MNTSKHTPGPWKVDESEHHAVGGERIYKVITDRPMGGLVADVSAWWVDTESARHNAHLIAAAPAMYEALQAMVIANHGMPINPMDEKDEICRQALEKAQKALAQAEGK